MGCSIPQISPHFHAYMYDARLLLLSTPKSGLKIGREEKGVSGVTFIFLGVGGSEVLQTLTLQHQQTISLLHRHIDPCKSSVLIFKMKYNLGSRRTFINNVFNTRQDKLLEWQICDLETAWLAFISMSLEKENFLRICVQSSNIKSH